MAQRSRYRQSRSMSEHILHTPNVKRLERSRTDKVLAGVSSGLGRYFDLTPTVFRLGFVVLTILGGAGILVYIAAALVIPKEGEERSIAEDVLSNRRDHPARLVALGLIAVAVLSLLARADTWPTAGSAWALILLAGLIFLWTRKGRGLMIGLLTFLALLVVITVAAVTTAFAWFDVSLGDGVGTQVIAPLSAPDAAYHRGIGQLELDVSHVPSTSNVNAHVGIGELRIIVPPDVPISLDAKVKAGSIDALGFHDDGTNANVETKNGGISIHARVGAGHIDIVRATP
jgi:phage shock protein PspC (stress-responsive transcriptional regulator)